MSAFCCGAVDHGEIRSCPDSEGRGRFVTRGDQRGDGGCYYQNYPPRNTATWIASDFFVLRVVEFRARRAAQDRKVQRKLEIALVTMSSISATHTSNNPDDACMPEIARSPNIERSEYRAQASLYENFIDRQA